MSATTGVGIGTAAIVLATAWALGGPASDAPGADIPPASADMAREFSGTPAASPLAGAQAADVASLEEVLGAARGLDPLACELAAGGVQGFWPGRSHMVALAADRGAAERVQEGLRAARGPAGARVLVEALVDGDGCPARLALGLLDRVEPEAAAPLVRPLLSDGVPERRRRAALAMGAVDSHADREAVERLLADASSGVRIAAAWALGEISDPASIPALARVLAGDDEPAVRGMAAEALGEIAG